MNHLLFHVTVTTEISKVTTRIIAWWKSKFRFNIYRLKSYILFSYNSANNSSYRSNDMLYVSAMLHELVGCSVKTFVEVLWKKVLDIDAW